MKIPSCFFGTYTDTKKECSKVARKLLNGLTLRESVESYPLIDTRINLEGCFLLIRTPGILGGQKHFHLSWISEIISSYPKMSKELEDTIINQMFEFDWSILGLSDKGYMWFFTNKYLDNRYRWQPFLTKLLEFWDEFWDEGMRYIGIGSSASNLWDSNSSFKQILGLMGVPEEEIVHPKHPGDFKMLCNNYHLLSMNVYEDENIAKRCGIII